MTKKMSQAELHDNKLCGCSIEKNPRNCIYQTFLDGWKYTPDVGNGASRGEIFTPRWVVDKMIVDSDILPFSAVYLNNYSDVEGGLRKYIDKRVFEPAVGTGNYTATILWHKMQLINELTKPKNGAKRTNAEMARYQAYTLVAVGSIYFNDIDAGNLQTTKARILRDTIINDDSNIEFWTQYLISNIETPIKRPAVVSFVKESVKKASKNWDTFDFDKGVLDVLYRGHNNGDEPPKWLEKAWREVIDENAKLFNGIKDEDSVEDGFLCPSRKNVVWTLWHFTNNIKEITAHKTIVPMAEQIKESELINMKAYLERLKANGENPEKSNQLFLMDDELFFQNKDDEKKFYSTQDKIKKLEKEIASFVPKIETVTYKRL